MSRESACVLCPNDLTMNGLVTQSLNAGITESRVNNSCGEAVGTNDAMHSFRSLNGNGRKKTPLPSKSKIYRFTGLSHYIRPITA